MHGSYQDIGWCYVFFFFFFGYTIKGIKGKQTKDHKSAGLYLYQHWFIGAWVAFLATDHKGFNSKWETKIIL